MGLVRLTRPVDFLLFLIVVFLGGWLSAGGAVFVQPQLGGMMCAALAAACVGAAANVANDLYDVDIDRANQRDRPLATGLVTTGAARALWLVLSLVGVVAAMGASPAHAVTAAASTALLWAYAARLKRLPGVGHALVGAVVGLGILYGAMAHSPQGVRAPQVMAGAGLAWLLVAMREIVKAIPDVTGDAAEGAATLPVVIGARASAYVAVAGLGLALATLPLFTRLGYDPLFLTYAVPMAGLVLGGVWHLLAADALGGDRPARWGACATRSSAWLKAGLAAGVIALSLGR